MSHETVMAWAAMVSAMAGPVTILVIILILRSMILPAISKGGIFRFKVKDLAEFSIEPSQVIRPPSTGVKSGEERFQVTSVVDETIQNTSDHLPLDYYFLNHISFFRKNKQVDFRKRSGFDLDHYDIQITVDSYYRDALDRIEYVEYVLHIRLIPNRDRYAVMSMTSFFSKSWRMVNMS